MTIALKYLPVLVLFLLAVMIPLIMLGMAGGAGPRQSTPRKMKLFESGVDPVGEPRHRYSVKFFLVALLFVIFDIEAVFIYPWAVLFRELGLFGLRRNGGLSVHSAARSVLRLEEGGPGMGVDQTCSTRSRRTRSGIITTRLDEVVRWARKNSLWPLPFGTACCAIEFMGVVARATFDISRFGAELVRFSPRQADLMLVAGTINYKLAPVLKRIYDQMPEPKYVISMGACACSGGFYDNYATVQGIEQIIPVDVFIPGCPPRPEAIMDALLKMQKRIDKEPVPKRGVSRDGTKSIEKMQDE